MKSMMKMLKGEPGSLEGGRWSYIHKYNDFCAELTWRIRWRAEAHEEGENMSRKGPP